MKIKRNKVKSRRAYLNNVSLKMFIKELEQSVYDNLSGIKTVHGFSKVTSINVIDKNPQDSVISIGGVWDKNKLTFEE